MKNILDKPIKAKTIKKKLEKSFSIDDGLTKKTLKITSGMKGNSLKKYKIYYEPSNAFKKKLGESIGDTHISTHYNYRDGKKTTYEVKFLGERGYSQKKIKEEPLQNNKPSIELIEKLDLHDMVKEHLNTDTVWDVNSWILLTILDKINEIIDELNSLKTRVNLIDEEDNN